MSTNAVCWLCGKEAILTEVEPHEDWLAVEGCACGSFLTWRALWMLRFRNLTAKERRTLSSRILAQPRVASGIRVVTQDGTVNGPFVIETR